MDNEQLLRDYLRGRLHHEIDSANQLFSSCTWSCIRWIKRYARCRSIGCTFLCLPFWIVMLPVAICLDLCIYLIVLVIFIVVFLLSILLAPCVLTYRFSSCKDACRPWNIYAYSLARALNQSSNIYMIFGIFWACYCGTGDLENGAPICCVYCCSRACQQTCQQATQVELTGEHCIIL